MQNRLQSLRGRLIADIISKNEEVRESGLIIIDRKSTSMRAKVISVGQSSQSINGKAINSPAKEGDIIHFRGYSSKIHQGDKNGLKKGLVTVWFEDVIGVEN